MRGLSSFNLFSMKKAKASFNWFIASNKPNRIQVISFYKGCHTCIFPSSFKFNRIPDIPQFSILSKDSSHFIVLQMKKVWKKGYSHEPPQ